MLEMWYSSTLCRSVLQPVQKGGPWPECTHPHSLDHQAFQKQNLDQPYQDLLSGSGFIYAARETHIGQRLQKGFYAWQKIWTTMQIFKIPGTFFLTNSKEAKRYKWMDVYVI